MAKSKHEDIVLENLKGFVRKGASSGSPGNVPTGHFVLDFVIQYGTTPDKVDLTTLEDYDPSKPLGLPLGKIVEFFGEEGGGKSSMAYRVVGFGQKLGYKCAWIDTENSFSDNLALINGMDKNELYYADMSSKDDPNKIFYAEDVLDSIIILMQNDVKVIVLDSVANLVPKVRMEASAEQKTIGLLARLMSENLGKVCNWAAKQGALVIFINQLREKIGLLWGDPKTSPGGRSLKHNASVKLMISKKGGKDADIFTNDENGQILIGRMARVNVKKNRLAKPYFEAIDVPIYYEPYFPEIAEMMFDVGRQLKLISVRKGVFKWNENDSVEHKADSKKVLVEKIKEPGNEKTLAKQLKEKASEVDVILPPEIVQWYEQELKKDNSKHGIQDEETPS